MPAAFTCVPRLLRKLPASVISLPLDKAALPVASKVPVTEAKSVARRVRSPSAPSVPPSVACLPAVNTAGPTADISPLVWISRAASMATPTP
ncbi:hypothetical protein D3C71_1482160 [compost metagenome]